MHKYLRIFVFSFLIVILEMFFLYPLADNILPSRNTVLAEQTIPLTGSGTWNLPDNVFSITIEAWGGGGGGAGPPQSANLSNGGGGGGGYARLTIINPDSSYSYSVGSGGNGGTPNNDNATNGGNSTFGGTVLIGYGGAKGVYASGGNGAGGAGGSGGGTGATTYNGGNGAAGSGSSAGGGGGGAGSSSNGTNANSSSGGAGGTGNTNGTGGDGSTANNANGTAGNAWGGGGGAGTGRNGTGAAGGAGHIRVTYTVNTPPTVSQNTDNAYNFSDDSTPTLEFTGTDPDGDRITYNIQIDTVDTFNSGNLLDKVSDTHLGFANTVTPADTEPFLSGQKMAYTVQSGDALDFGTYYWKVRGKDPQRTDTYGSWSSTRTFIIDAGISIILTSDGNINYGPITAGGNKSTIDLTDTQTIQNNGLSTINLNISTSNAVGDTYTWTLGSAVGETDIFVHEFSSNSGTDWTKFTTPNEYQALSSGLISEGTQDFDLRVTVPSLVSDYGIKTISISVRAVLP